MAFLLVLWATAIQARPAPPDPADQKAAEKLVRDIFKDDYAKKSPPDRSALARRLLSQAQEAGTDAAQRFVLLREARELAREAADWETAQKAIEETGRAFQVDTVGLKAALFAVMIAAAKKPEEWAAMARKELALAEEASTADLLDAAQKAVSEASSLAKKAKDMALAAKADAKAKEISDRRTWQVRVSRATETLAKSPDDAEANFVAGRQEGLLKGNWEGALLHLAKGSDPALKAAAAKDLARPEDPAGQVAVGDAWWDLAEKDLPARLNLRLRAVDWYEKAGPSATGLVKSKVDLRLLEARFDRFPGTWVDKTDPRPYGIIAKEGDPISITAEKGNSIRADLDKPLVGDWDGVSARIRFGKDRTTAAAVWFESLDCGVSVLVNFLATAFVYKVGAGAYEQNPKLSIAAKDDYVVLVILSEGNYVYYLDGKEMARRPTKATRLTNLAFYAENGTVSFDQIRLRKK